MRIKMLQSFVRVPDRDDAIMENVDYLEGQEYEVDEKHGRSWTHARLAERVHPAPEKSSETEAT